MVNSKDELLFCICIANSKFLETSVKVCGVMSRTTDRAQPHFVLRFTSVQTSPQNACPPPMLQAQEQYTEPECFRQEYVGDKRILCL